MLLLCGQEDSRRGESATKVLIELRWYCKRTVDSVDQPQASGCAEGRRIRIVDAVLL